MTASLKDMLRVLTLKKIEENLFRGESRDIGSRSVFGGQVLGQALVAACRTVSGRNAHSLHAYFLRPGDVNAPILYDVERIRDGRSFNTRRVVAIQHGRPIFNMAVSFQLEERGFEHQSGMPDVPAPDDLPSIADLRQRAAERDPERFRNRPIRQLPVDIRPIQPADPYVATQEPPFQSIWFRTVDAVPSDRALHQSILAYASDFVLLRTATLPFGRSLRGKNAHMASLDHAMWFHRDFRMDEWLLFTMESPSASNARGLALGKVFTQDGRLIATVAQEGLMRVMAEADQSTQAQREGNIGGGHENRGDRSRSRRALLRC
jgi:acyl-CoA thioesterase-2